MLGHLYAGARQGPNGASLQGAVREVRQRAGVRYPCSMPDTIRDFARKVVALQAKKEEPEGDIEILPPDLPPEPNIVERAITAPAAYIQAHPSLQLSPERKANLEAEITKARNNAAIWAEPKAFFLETRIPGASAIRRAIENATRR
jgi:hypothetical protein